MYAIYSEFFCQGFFTRILFLNLTVAIFRYKMRDKSTIRVLVILSLFCSLQFGLVSANFFPAPVPDHSIEITASGVVTATITLENPGSYYGIAYDSDKSEIFLTNVDFDLVSVISDNTNAVVANIPVGSQPVGIAYDSAKGELFVANYASDSVSVISDITNTVVANIPVGSQPFAVAYDSGKGEIFVVNYNSSSVSVISDSTNTVIANVTLENQPQGISYDSGKGEIFVSYSESNRVSVISGFSLPLPSPSISEFPPWIMLPIFLIATLFMMIITTKLFLQSS